MAMALSMAAGVGDVPLLSVFLEITAGKPPRGVSARFVLPDSFTVGLVSGGHWLVVYFFAMRSLFKFLNLQALTANDASLILLFFVHLATRNHCSRRETSPHLLFVYSASSFV